MALDITIPVRKRQQQEGPGIVMKQKPTYKEVLRTIEEQKLKKTETEKALNFIEKDLSASQKKNIVEYLDKVADIESSGGTDVYGKDAEGIFQFKVSDNSFQDAKDRYVNLAKEKVPNWIYTAKTPMELDWDSQRALTVINMIMRDPETKSREYLMDIANKGYKNNTNSFYLWKKFHQAGPANPQEDSNALKKLGLNISLNDL